jgi:nucleotide-binding universal stress UspA family protein
MFKRMLAAVDESVRSRLVIQAGRALAERSGGALVALRVRSDIADHDNVTEDDLALAAQTSDLRAAGVAAHFLVHTGSAERQIIQTAQRQRSTLIIIAAREHGPRVLPHRRMTARLAKRAPAPLLVIPELDTDVQSGVGETSLFGAEDAPILVALDGSALAEQAVPYAVELADLLGRPLTLLHVASPLRSQAQLAQAWAYVEAARRRIREDISRDLHVDVQVVAGALMDELLWAVEGRRAGVLALAAHGQREGTAQGVSAATLEILRNLRIAALVIPAPVLAGGAKTPRPGDDSAQGAEI